LSENDNTDNDYSCQDNDPTNLNSSPAAIIQEKTLKIQRLNVW